MRLLILGGTVFLGRHIVTAATERGHELTLVNRGLSNPEPLPRVETIRGDRERDLAVLAGRSWDAVIDTSGYLPRVVRASAEQLADSVERYLFVSSISAYGTFRRPGIDERVPAAPSPAPEEEDIANHYGELKAACERAVEAVLPGRTTGIRPGLIVGPHDPTGRFTYWVRRLAEDGRVLAPRAPDQPVQLIDARDLAAWIVHLAEARATGVYNATGPGTRLTFDTMLERVRSAAGGKARLVWIEEDRLAEAGVQPWSELPLWLDLPRHPDFAGFLDVDITRALAAGLTFRPLGQTVLDTLAWIRERPSPPAGEASLLPPPAGMAREREHELLERLAG